MFTGIVEETGSIEEIRQLSENAIVMKIKADIILADLTIGASIAVNGVCLTVTSFTKENFTVEMMPETVQATALSILKEGSSVNLERSLLPTDRIGGHFVTGHVDGTGKIVQKEALENAVYYDIEAGEEILQYVTHKGSIAVDGISLTVFAVDRNAKTFTISIIPHTMAVTALGEKDVGDLVNLECDMLAKQVQHFLQLQHNQV